MKLTIAGNITDGKWRRRADGPRQFQRPRRVVLLGTNSYTGGTTICDCATLQLGDAAHKASIVGEVAVDGQFDIVNANTTGITKIVNDGFNGIATTTFYNATPPRPHDHQPEFWHHGFPRQQYGGQRHRFQ